MSMGTGFPSPSSPILDPTGKPVQGLQGAAPAVSPQPVKRSIDLKHIFKVSFEAKWVTDLLKRINISIESADYIFCCYPLSNRIVDMGAEFQSVYFFNLNGKLHVTPRLMLYGVPFVLREIQRPKWFTEKELLDAELVD